MTARNLALLNKPLLKLEREGEAAFTLESFTFANQSRGNYEVAIEYADGSAQNLALDFGSDADATQRSNDLQDSLAKSVVSIEFFPRLSGN